MKHQGPHQGTTCRVYLRPVFFIGTSLFCFLLSGRVAGQSDTRAQLFFDLDHALSAPSMVKKYVHEALQELDPGIRISVSADGTQLKTQVDPEWSSADIISALATRGITGTAIERPLRLNGTGIPVVPFLEDTGNPVQDQLRFETALRMFARQYPEEYKRLVLNGTLPLLAE